MPDRPALMEYFSFDGRYSRLQWVVGQALGLAAVSFVSAAVMPSAFGALSGELETGDGLPLIGILVSAVLAIWVSTAASVKRLHDRGRSGVWLGAALIPLVGPIWQFCELALLPGERRANRFGPPPGGVIAQRSVAIEETEREPLSEIWTSVAEAIDASAQRLSDGREDMDATAQALEKNRRRYDRLTGDAATKNTFGRRRD